MKAKYFKIMSEILCSSNLAFNRVFNVKLECYYTRRENVVTLKTLQYKERTNYLLFVKFLFNLYNFIVVEDEQSIDKDTRLNKELDLTQACLMINPKVSRNILGTGYNDNSIVYNMSVSLRLILSYTWMNLS